MGTPVYSLPVSAAALREIDLLGVFRYANTYPEGIELLSNQNAGSPDLSRLITHRYKGLVNAEKAFQMAGRTKDDSGRLVLKVMIDMDEDEGHEARL